MIHSIDQISICRARQVSALPPEHQTAREKAAILKDPRLISLLQGEEVFEIRKVPGGYMVVTDQGREIPVKVTYVPGGIGPLKFTLEFNKS